MELTFSDSIKFPVLVILNIAHVTVGLQNDSTVAKTSAFLKMEFYLAEENWKKENMQLNKQTNNPKASCLGS